VVLNYILFGCPWIESHQITRIPLSSLEKNLNHLFVLFLFFIFCIGHQNKLRVLYCQAKPAAPKVKSSRHIPQAEDRILDAPDLLDDYCKLLKRYFPLLLTILCTVNSLMNKLFCAVWEIMIGLLIYFLSQVTLICDPKVKSSLIL